MAERRGHHRDGSFWRGRGFCCGVCALGMGGLAWGQLLPTPVMGGEIVVDGGVADGSALPKVRSRAQPAVRPFAPVRVVRTCTVSGLGVASAWDVGTFRLKGPVSDPLHRRVDPRLLASYDPETFGRLDEPMAAAVDPAEAALDEARALLARGQARRASDRLEAALRADPEPTRLWQLYGAALLASGRTAEAAERLHEVYTVDPVLALEPGRPGLWFRGGLSEARRHASKVRMLADRHDTGAWWVAATVTALWAEDAGGASVALERARAAGAEGTLCDRLGWAADLLARGEAEAEGGAEAGGGP